MRTIFRNNTLRPFFIRCPLRKRGHAVVLRADNLLARVIFRSPMWVPIYVMAVRVGERIDTHVAVGWIPLSMWR